MHVVIAQISNDHDVLKMVLDSVGLLIEMDKLEDHRSDLPKMADFFEGFMDGYHHKKEELTLFPLLEKAPEEIRSQVPILIGQHRQAKKYADELKKAADENDISGFTAAAKDLIPHMWAHIGREDNLVFPFLLDMFTGTEMDLKVMHEQNTFVNGTFGREYLQRMWGYAAQLQMTVRRESEKMRIMRT